MFTPFHSHFYQSTRKFSSLVSGTFGGHQVFFKCSLSRKWSFIRTICKSTFPRKLGGRPNLLRIHIPCKCVRAQMLLIWDGQWRLHLWLCLLLLAIWNFQSVYFFLSPEIVFIISYTEHLLLSTDSGKETIVTRSGRWCLIHVNIAKKPLQWNLSPRWYYHLEHKSIKVLL